MTRPKKKEGTPGRLPRTTFIDDPFFHDSFGGFSRSPNTQRRFGGSTPRLFDDENDFFDDFRNKIPFGSLPRRQQSRSPNLPRHEPPMDYQNDRQERHIPVQRMSPNNSSMPPTGPNQTPKKVRFFCLCIVGDAHLS
uniref:Uncharacterized protein n=1 Tax=Panagrolaimus sp. JU765 TaxID=591449 RepID=A0AC34Q7K5_9BILA